MLYNIASLLPLKSEDIHHLISIHLSFLLFPRLNICQLHYFLHFQGKKKKKKKYTFFCNVIHTSLKYLSFIYIDSFHTTSSLNMLSF